MASMKPLIVVVGLGQMGICHAESLAKVRAVRVGLASSRSDVLESCSRRLCADRTFNSYEEALDDPDVSGIVIATPGETHPALIEKAAVQGKHIFSEKPLGLDPADIASALQQVERAGVRFMAGFMRRWDPDYAAARAAVESGKLGDPVVFKCTSGDPEYPEKYHRRGMEYSILRDLAIHDIDLARWLTFSEVKSVYVVCDALTYPTLKESNDADVCVAILEMVSGTKVVLHLSRALGFGYDVTSELFCKKGAIQIGELKKTAMATIQEETNTVDVKWDFVERFRAAFERQMEAFAAVVLADSNDEASSLMKKDSSYATGHDGLIATVVAEALVASCISGVPELVKYI